MSSSSIIATSHAINDGSAKSTVSLLPPPPPPSAPKVKVPSKKEAEKKEEKLHDEDKEKRRVKLYYKLVHYFRSKYISKYIPDDFKEPRPSDSYESLCALEEAIKGFVHIGSKELIVNNMLKLLCEGGEGMAVGMMKLDQFAGISNHLLDDTEYLQPELEEIAIELSDSWVPDAKTRCFLKLCAKGSEYVNRRTQGSSSGSVRSDGYSSSGKSFEEHARP